MPSKNSHQIRSNHQKKIVFIRANSPIERDISNDSNFAANFLRPTDV